MLLVELVSSDVVVGGELSGGNQNPIGWLLLLFSSSSTTVIESIKTHLVCHSNNVSLYKTTTMHFIRVLYGYKLTNCFSLRSVVTRISDPHKRKRTIPSPTVCPNITAFQTYISSIVSKFSICVNFNAYPQNCLAGQI